MQRGSAPKSTRSRSRAARPTWPRWKLRWTNAWRRCSSPRSWPRTFETAQPDAFYAALTEHAPEHGVSEMFALDDDLESVFRYLVKQ